MTNWWSRLLDLISPRLCVVCGRRLAPTERSLCSVCVLHLPRTTYQFTPEDNLMARLFWGQVPIERSAALMFYEPHSEMAQMVYRLKYDNRPDIGEDLGRLMASEMQMARFFDDIDFLLPVPLSPKRLRQRGYNQSEMLTVGINDITKIPVVTNVLKRRFFHQSQTTLSRQDRQENVTDMFCLSKADVLQGKHVLLVDDICTTGATLTACANVLKEIPSVRISILTLGLTKS